MWILLIFVYIGNGAGIDHIEGFSSQQSCSYAKNEIDNKHFGIFSNEASLCIEKN